MADEKRPYRKKRRAQLEAETRRRITESAVELHGSVGPARTSMSAVAERAGVRRSTLYRHFPDERALFGACSAHWSEANPPPDLDSWSAVEDPDERLTAALVELYRHYRGTERMMSNIMRDAELMPVVAEALQGYRDYMQAAREILTEGRRERGRARSRARAAIGHALEFGTWRSLARGQGLDDEEAARLMSAVVSPCS